MQNSRKSRKRKDRFGSLKIETRPGRDRMLEGPFPDTLDQALDSAFMTEALTKVVQKHFGQGYRIAELHVEHLERRLIRYGLELVNSGQDERKQWMIVGKVYHKPEQVGYCMNLMQMLVENGFSAETTDAIRIPQPLDCVPEIGVLLMEEVPGTVLRALIKNMKATEDHIRLLARATAKLHRCPISVGRCVSVEERLLACDPAPEVIAEQYPELASDIQNIVDTARQIQREIGDGEQLLVHGDFHPGQVTVDNGHLWILDIDNLKNGDPAFDLAKMFAFFKRTARKQKKSAYIDTMKDIFIAEYFDSMDWEIARRIPLYEALVSLKRASKCLRVQDEAGWEDKIKRLVPQAAACIRVMQACPEKLDLDSVLELYHQSPGMV